MAIFYARSSILDKPDRDNPDPPDRDPLKATTRVGWRSNAAEGPNPGRVPHTQQRDNEAHPASQVQRHLPHKSQTVMIGTTRNGQSLGDTNKQGNIPKCYSTADTQDPRYVPLNPNH